MPAQEPPVRPKFACEEEAALLLNCVSADEYVEHKCVQYMKRLRKCVQRERIVNFELLPDTNSAEPTADEKQDTPTQVEVSKSKDAQ